FKLLSNRDGLSTILTRSIFQDSKGYMWIATMSGLNRFNGYDITVFKNIPGDSLSITDNRIRRIFEASDGSLWVGTNNGLNRHSIQTTDDNTPINQELFENFYFSSEEDGQNDIWSFAEDKAGNLWIGTAKNIRILPKNKFTNPTVSDFKIFTPNTPLWPKSKRVRISSLTCDRQGNMWIATIGGGVFFKPFKSDTLLTFQHNANNPNSLSSNYVLTIKEDSKGIIWIGTYLGGLNRYDPIGKSFRHYKNSPTSPKSISDNKVYDIVEYRNSYWIATLGGGINHFDPKTEVFTRFQHVETDPNSLANDNIRDILVDASENLWILTNRGVNIMDLKPQKFQHIKHDPYNKNSISHDYVSAVYDANFGEVWFGHNRGIDKMDKNGNFRFYKVLHDNPRSRDGYVYSIAGNQQGELFLSTFGGGIFKYNSAKDLFAPYPVVYREANTQIDSRAHALYFDKTNTAGTSILWIGDSFGLSRRLPDGRLTRKLWDAEDAATIETVIGHITQGVFGLLWVGTTDGLYAVDLIYKRVKHYTHDPLNQHSLSNNTINFLHVFDNKLWIATNNGLSILDITDHNQGFPLDRFKRLFTKDGLADNYLASLQSDSSGKLWIATDNGLSCYKLSTGSIRNYGFEDNLQTINFVQGASAKLTSGDLVFGSQNGAIRFNPYSLEHNPHPPKVILTAFKRVGKTELSGVPLNQTSKIKLAYDDRLVSFEFAALDYTKSEYNRYSYKLWL
ncbi:MAG: two-component regulator propeller domain-containing protein, partial [Calditrichota bacterium]